MDAVLGSQGDGSHDFPGEVTRTVPLTPAGVLYFRLDDPIIKSKKSSTEEEIEKAIMRDLKMKGLLLADVKLLKEMDRQIEGESLIIPARLNKGDVLGKSSAATIEQFDMLRGHVRKTLVAIGEEMLNGNVSISPFKKRTNTACTYCDFSPVCQFDTAMKDNKYRLLGDIKDDEVWKLIDGEKGDS
jgi:ATP-dependent helicase/nuclease subunit B